MVLSQDDSEVSLVNSLQILSGGQNHRSGKGNPLQEVQYVQPCCGSCTPEMSHELFSLCTALELKNAISGCTGALQK